VDSLLLLEGVGSNQSASSFFLLAYRTHEIIGYIAYIMKEEDEDSI
jgi:hypothetical protein